MKKKLLLFVFLCAIVLTGFQIAGELDLHLLQSPGATVDNYQEPDYDLGPGHIDSLMPYPAVKKGERTPFDLWKYGGKGNSSFMNPDLPMSWEEWLAFHKEQKPELMKDIRAYMNSRYDFRGEAYPRSIHVPEAGKPS
jgi:hypothetical protein